MSNTLERFRSLLEECLDALNRLDAYEELRDDIRDALDDLEGEDD